MLPWRRMPAVSALPLSRGKLAAGIIDPRPGDLSHSSLPTESTT